MSLTKYIAEKGFNPNDFAAEIASLDDQGSESRQYCSYLGESVDPSRHYSYKGVFDIKVEPDGRKLFKFSFNKQNGSGPMSYWWTVESLVSGKWVELYGSGHYYGCRNYPEGTTWR